MIVTMRILALVLLLPALAMAGLLVLDLVKAFIAQPCLTGANCYPWGAEGPAAESWSYQSKKRYLAFTSTIAVLVFTICAAAIRILFKPDISPRSGFASLLIPALGVVLLYWFDHHLV